MPKTPHKDKLVASRQNPKCKSDLAILQGAEQAYEQWMNKIKSITSEGKQKITEMTCAFNEYKDYLEVELIANKGSTFIKRQKGQLKLDNSILEEFIIHLVDASILENLPPGVELETGPKTMLYGMTQKQR